ncbi:MAG: hypothetical protein RL264_2838 [Bacteroidota bacterium]|jgi:hypothetical protein
MVEEYNDSYESCHETFVTLRIYSVNIFPDEISKTLNTLPSDSVKKGDVFGNKTNKKRNINGWFLTSKGFVESKDCRKHFDYLADKIISLKPKLIELQNRSCQIDISCFWSSENGQGGPTLSPKQLKKLAELELEIWFDIY